MAEGDVWAAMRSEAEAALIEEPLYAGLIQATVLDQRSLSEALAYRLAHRLGDGDLSRLTMRDLCFSAFEADPHAGLHAVRDLIAIRERDLVRTQVVQPDRRDPAQRGCTQGALGGSGVAVRERQRAPGLGQEPRMARQRRR